MSDEIKIPQQDKNFYCICNMDADFLCEILKKEVSFGTLMEVIYRLNSDIAQTIWRTQNDR